jgi:hypothetical protein
MPGAESFLTLERKKERKKRKKERKKERKTERKSRRLGLCVVTST